MHFKQVIKKKAGEKYSTKDSKGSFYGSVIILNTYLICLILKANKTWHYTPPYLSVQAASWQLCCGNSVSVQPNVSDHLLHPIINSFPMCLSDKGFHLGRSLYSNQASALLAPPSRIKKIEMSFMMADLINF